MTTAQGAGRRTALALWMRWPGLFAAGRIALAGRTGRALAALLAIAIATAVGHSAGPRSAFNGLSTDLLFWLRDRTFGVRGSAAASDIAVVLVDEATYAAPEFSNEPKEMWTPQFGAVLAAIDAAAPRAIGFDIILPTTLGILKPDFDGPFLRALRQASPLLVLAKFQGSADPILPYRAFVLMAGGDSHVRSINLGEDADGVTRSLPLLIGSAGHPPEPSFALDLAQRGAGAPLALPREPEVQLNFDGGNPFPAYSFVDLVDCQKAGNTAFFAAHFHNRIVLIGSGLDVEDRRLTSRRFINPPERTLGDRCTPAPPATRAAFARPTLPGVYIHATAIDNLLRGQALRPLGLISRIGWVAAAAALAALLCLALPLLLGGAALAALLAAIAAAATVLFQHAVLAPMLAAMLAAIIAYFLLLGFRLLVTDRDKRLIRQMFGLYLSPSVVEPMIAAGRMPALGGERREMSFLFSDVAGFTTLTEASDPTRLAPVLNAYFDGICQAVMANRGLVVEFVGDGVLAFFGAPAHERDHAACALACARAIDAFTERFRAEGEAAALGFGHTRIGVHTGDAVVGNFGGTQRFKYAALGDVVNSTSRLEGLNKYFGTHVCVSEAVRGAAGESHVRQIGEFLMKGKVQPVAVYELLDPQDAESAFMTDYAQAYRMLREGEAGAAEAFRALARLRPQDGCVRFYLERIEAGRNEALVVMSDK